MITFKNPSGKPEKRTCTSCGLDFVTLWKAAVRCDPCVKLVKQTQAKYETAGYLPPKLYQRYTLIDGVKSAVDGSCLVILSGPSRTGKTCQLHLALAHLSRRYKVRMVDASHLSRMSDGDLAEVESIQVLGIDDLGTRTSEAIRANLCTILNHRTANLLKTIITTNLTAAQIRSLDERLAGRIEEGAQLALTQIHSDRSIPTEGATK